MNKSFKGISSSKSQFSTKLGTFRYNIGQHNILTLPNTIPIWIDKKPIPILQKSQNNTQHQYQFSATPTYYPIPLPIPPNSIAHVWCKRSLLAERLFDTNTIQLFVKNYWSIFYKVPQECLLARDQLT